MDISAHDAGIPDVRSRPARDFRWRQIPRFTLQSDVLESDLLKSDLALADQQAMAAAFTFAELMVLSIMLAGLVRKRTQLRTATASGQHPRR